MKHAPVHLEHERQVWSQGFAHVAGVDEAGRGPLAGPVVAAAVIFPHDYVIEGVTDSKKLSEKKRVELFEVISHQALAVGVGIVDHEVIDRINILQAATKAMALALDDLKIHPEFALVDGNSFRHPTLPFQNIIKGDAISFTIAAASIVAKVTRDRLMCELDIHYPHYGFAKHKGYGTQAHIEAIRAYGLSAVHRRSFHPSALQGSLEV
jgi:ribonuclease HII